MRIAFIVHDLNRSWGHSRYVAELAERFCREHEVHVFANTFVPDSGLAQVILHRIPAWRSNAFATILSFLGPATLQQLKSFDIVHSQGLCGLRQNVITAHQCNREWFLSRQRVEGRLGWKEQVFGTVISGIEGIFYRSVRKSRVIAISERIRRDLQGHYGCRARMEMIHHGTDTVRFTPERPAERASCRRLWNIDEEHTAFLFVGDLRKGARQCIVAMQAFPNDKLILVSRSPVAPWKEMVRKEGVADRVIFAGPSEAVETIYPAADVFLLPTPYDPFALVATEAMSCGLPIVVSREAGAAELVEHGENGLILQDVSDTGELARHMRKLASDRNFARRLGRAARMRQEKMTWDDVAAQTMRVYEEQLAMERASGSTFRIVRSRR
jgi:UDP-glucose:(heptosyl)LPS alpha-1,3-glucosyltransferase